MNLKKLSATLCAVLFFAYSHSSVHGKVLQKFTSNIYQDDKSFDEIINDAEEAEDIYTNMEKLIDAGAHIQNKDHVVENTVTTKKGKLARIKDFFVKGFGKIKSFTENHLQKLKEKADKIKFAVGKFLKAAVTKGKGYIIAAKNILSNQVNNSMTKLEKCQKALGVYVKAADEWVNKTTKEVQLYINIAGITIKKVLTDLPDQDVIKELGLPNCTELADKVQTDSFKILKHVTGCVTDKIDEMKLNVSSLQHGFFDTAISSAEFFKGITGIVSKDNSLKTGNPNFVKTTALKVYQSVMGPLATLISSVIEFGISFFSVDTPPSNLCIAGSLQHFIEDLTVNRVKLCVNEVINITYGGNVAQAKYLQLC